MDSGQYWELVEKGFIKGEENLEPETGHLQFYLDAYHELATCRPSGFDIGPIPFTAIVEYSRIYDVGDFEDFKEIIQRVDAHVLRLAREEQDKKKKAGDNVNTGTNDQSGVRHKGK